MSLRWSLVELWDDLHYPGRRQTLRRALCIAGLHWPVSFWATRGGYDSPPEFNWACEMCGHERLPYRAILWSIHDRIALALASKESRA